MREQQHMHGGTHHKDIQRSINQHDLLRMRVAFDMSHANDRHPIPLCYAAAVYTATLWSLNIASELENHQEVHHLWQNAPFSSISHSKLLVSFRMNPLESPFFRAPERWALRLEIDLAVLQTQLHHAQVPTAGDRQGFKVRHRKNRSFTRKSP